MSDAVSQHAKLTYADGAGSFVQHYPTLAEAAEAYRLLGRHLQMTAVIETSSGYYEDEEIASLLADTGTGALSAEGEVTRTGKGPGQ